MEVITGIAGLQIENKNITKIELYYHISYLPISVLHLNLLTEEAAADNDAIHDGRPRSLQPWSLLTMGALTV